MRLVPLVLKERIIEPEGERPKNGNFTPAVYEVLSCENKTRPYLTGAVLLAVDVGAVGVAFAAAVALRYSFGSGLNFSTYWELSPLLLLFSIFYAGAKLYSGTMFPPPEELRRLTYATSAVFLTLAVFALLTQTGMRYSRGVFFLAWGLALVAVPLARAAIRALYVSRPWWGRGVLILGAGYTCAHLVRTLQENPQLGLKPIALLDDDPVKQKRELHGVPVVGACALAPKLARRLRLSYAAVAMPGVSRARLVELLGQHGWPFRRTLLIPDLFGFSSLWVTSRDLGGILGLELREQLLLPIPMLVKRTLDLVLALVGGLFILPLLGLIALAIKLDSRGPVFYRSERMGRDGHRFVALKFRSMRGDGEALLRELLQRDPEKRKEYEQYHKLTSDPRVTPVGRLLRAWSLDELPQLWNVLKGDMSLVGPRAYLERERPDMGEKSNLILKVRPGITGLWQVSGRNERTFGERVDMDVYYARNWSVWLDFWILARTATAVLQGKGAY
ncbi:Undecaprenyl-phosphate galactosephosphotransferase [Nitrosococcus oceani ATCC 19707]|uniref:Undecaprenyl-phosphate galactosephosphotransferase n=1 Tax=Nitrosococcus oceani (strain ATCC 19707 / BCRC 17464 / JCM 30415 / NCIMB 11848 / C-107) TaxID=323261 RepID=Q3JB03_NITOC|nr:sugar transferase [Nitrosococcus oceani]ABA57993.1 Undecaprenyl-phosphate galactosephosphotransferase [Nitrosococcus oceani ATCC 19707]